jgi:hypothetical protein
MGDIAVTGGMSLSSDYSYYTIYPNDKSDTSKQNAKKKPPLLRMHGQGTCGFSKEIQEPLSPVTFAKFPYTSNIWE